MGNNMTKEEKRLLLKDLCARLGYGVLVMVHDDEINEPVELLSIYPKRDKPLEIDDGWDENSSTYWNLEDVKPYLRPMSSMTEEERKEWFKQSRVEYDCEFHTEPTLSLCNCHLSTDWLNKKMFDYRGLIPMGLALPAKEGMYNKMEE